MNQAKRYWPALLAMLALQPSVYAADAPAAATPSPTATATAADEEAQVDDGLKRFGYLTGLARGCVVENQRVALEREALDLSAAIGRLLGTDRAFLFASAFGYGTAIETAAKDCPDVLTAYEARVDKFRAGRGGAQ